MADLPPSKRPSVSFEAFSPEEVADFIKAEVPMISTDILETIQTQKIDGEVLQEMSEEDFVEIAPRLGDRLKLKKASGCTDSVKAAGSTKTTLSSASISTDPIHIANSDDSEDSETSVAALSPLPIHEPDDLPQNLTQSPQGLINEKSTVSQEHSAPSDSGQLSADWAEQISIPSRFSTSTTDALTSGVPTPKARDEIVNALSTIILVHTINPNSRDFGIICKKLIDKHPVLKDSIGSGYDSWKKKLIMKFKNLRRPTRAAKAGVTSKKLENTREKTVFEPSASDLAEYDQHVKHIQKSYVSQKWSLASMQILLEQTGAIRRQWIRDQFPPVQQVLEKFPCLKEPKLMIKEFCDGTGATEKDMTDSWSNVEEQVIKYAAHDERKIVKSLLTQYKDIEEELPDRTTSYVMKLLAVFLYPRGKGRHCLMESFEGESVIIDDCIDGIDCRAPYIAGFGATFDELTDFKVIVEKENVLSMPSLKTAIHCCFAAYYVFNISYPPHLSPFLLFLEQYVYKLKPSQKLSLSVSTVIESLKKV